jgi:hypothetical protein
MKILAIDPGPKESALVSLHHDRIAESMKVPNQVLLGYLRTNATEENHMLVVEMIASYGMAVGAEVFETVVWIGRFTEAWDSRANIASALMYRLNVKMHLCHDSRAKDPNIRQALIDRFGPGKDRAIGTKKNPGPLYGVAGDVWSALAVAVTFADQQQARMTA